METNIAGQVVHVILGDLKSRPGLKRAFEFYDEDAQDEIRLAWEAIAERIIRERLGLGY